MKVLNLQQGSPEWLLEHSSRVTASRIQDGVLAKGRGGAESSGRRNYRAQIACTILTGRPAKDRFRSQAMEDGIEEEPFGRSSYEVLTGSMVDQVGFVIHPTMERAGASPDGLVGDKGCIQIKCPYAATHIAWLLAGVVPEEHKPQMLWEMDSTERDWCDFVSYCSELPDNLQLFVVRFHRDEGKLREMRAEVKIFLNEVDALVEKLKERK